MERLKIFKVSISNGSREKFERQIYCKTWFSDRVFYVTFADADNRSRKSLHTLFNKYLDNMLVKIWTKSYGPNYTKYWAFWPKTVKHFWQSVDAILEVVSVTVTMFLC